MTAGSPTSPPSYGDRGRRQRHGPIRRGRPSKLDGAIGRSYLDPAGERVRGLAANLPVRVLDS